MSEFLEMSGYGAYVWSSYGLAFVVLVFNVWSARRRLREELIRTQRRNEIQQQESTS